MDFDDMGLGLLILGLVIFTIALIGVLIDDYYLYPIATENANKYCQTKGFDQSKDFKRVGFFSTEPTGVRCEYAERYTDLGIRTN